MLANRWRALEDFDKICANEGFMNEYRATVGRVGYLVDPVSVKTLLADEIVITQEVRQAALR